ncbi:MAG: hypothetical protein AAGD32_06520 [Planctomycetota bacterium]
MRRRTSILLPAVGALVIHAGVAGSMWLYGVNHQVVRIARTERPAPTRVDPIYVEEPQVLLPEIKSIWGESAGQGNAINSADGPVPQAGPDGFQEQAASSSNSGLALPPQEERMARPPGGGFVVPDLPGRLPTFPEPSPREGEDSSQDQEPQEAQESRPQSDGGEPRPPGESDLQAATTVREATFNNGAVDARFGREFRLAPAQYFLAMRDEIGFAQFPIIVIIDVTLDAEGNVLDVFFQKRSPSPSLDRTVELTLYRSWFEPVEGEPTFRANFVFTR